MGRAPAYSHGKTVLHRAFVWVLLLVVPVGGAQLRATALEVDGASLEANSLSGAIKEEVFRPKGQFRRHVPKHGYPSGASVSKRDTRLAKKRAKAAKQQAARLRRTRQLKSSARFASKAAEGPAHFHEIDRLPLRHFGKEKCGDKLSAKKMGLKDASDVVADFWKNRFGGLGFFQTANGSGLSTSMARPGAGANQKLADNGLSEGGTINNIEPFARVYKDGFSQVGCYKDSMHEKGDKYGNNKFKYKLSETNVSVVRYSEVILDEFQKAMTPEICYEFCRTVPDMVFFGITNGRDCYCEPYFKPTAADEKPCDAPCEGDTAQMCGSVVKSTIFEMHYCQDTSGEVFTAAAAADEVLAYFYDTAFFVNAIANHVLESGTRLQEVAGHGGDGAASDFGQLAKVSSGDLERVLVGDDCPDAYISLLEAYRDAESIRSMDFALAANLQKADDNLQKLRKLTPKVDACAKSSEARIKLSYPFFEEFSETVSEDDFQEDTDAFANALKTYYPAPYLAAPLGKPASSTCTGKVRDHPAPISFAACTEACDRAAGSGRCVAFQFFYIAGDSSGNSSDILPLCILFSKIDTVVSHECDLLPEIKSTLQSSVNSVASGFLQKSNSTVGGLCEKLQKVITYSGLTCAALYGADSSVFSECPAECRVTEGTELSSVCMVSQLDANMRKVEKKLTKRCFGGDMNKLANQSAAQLLPIVDIGADGPIVGGDQDLMDGSAVEEPFEDIWTRSTESETA